MKKIILTFITILLITGCSNNKTNNSGNYYNKNENTSYVKEDYVYEDEEEFDIESIKLKSIDDSSCFSYVGYENDFKILLLVFKEEPNRCYKYDDISYSDYKDFINSDSLGSYYNAYIKPYYDYSYRYDDINVIGNYVVQ